MTLEIKLGNIIELFYYCSSTGLQGEEFNVSWEEFTDAKTANLRANDLIIIFDLPGWFGYLFL